MKASLTKDLTEEQKDILLTQEGSLRSIIKINRLRKMNSRFSKFTYLTLVDSIGRIELQLEKIDKIKGERQVFNL